MKKLFALLLCIATLLVCLPTTVFAVTTISSVSITNVDAPTAGKAPDTSVTVSTQGTKLYAIDWLDKTTDHFLEAGDTFIAGHVYQVQVWVEAKDGYEFRYTDSKTPNVNATIDSKTATVTKAFEYNAWAMVVASYTYPACPENTIQYLAVALPGVKLVGNMLQVEENSLIPYELMATSAPVSLYPELNLNRYYPEGFRWTDTTKSIVHYNGDRFKGGRDYYVHIALTPKSGSFTNDLVVSINGKQATIKAKGATYAEVGVEVTCFGTITGPDVRPVVILPKDGNSPDQSPTYAAPQCKNIDYAAVSGWYDVETGKKMTSGDKFVGGKQYRVELYCMAAYPYTFDQNPKYLPQITGVDVDSYSFGYDDYRGRELIYLTKTFTAITPDHTCTAGPWQCDESGHSNYCTICGKAQAGGAHWSQNDATCAHGKLCEVCGYEFTEPTETHTPDTKWTACANLYHAKLCTVCGAHCTPEDHVPGPAATETAPQTCTVCGYIITPAKNHRHDLSRVPSTPADCVNGGNIEYYFCTGCNDCFTDAEGKNKIPETDTVLLKPLGHTPTTGWSKNDTHHWRVCTTCAQVIPETKASHTPDKAQCSVCIELTVPDATAPVESAPAITPTVPTTPTAPQQVPEKPEKTDPWVIILLALVCFAAAVTATVIILEKKAHKGDA